MKLNEKSNKNSINSNNKFDLIKNYTNFNNYSFKMKIQKLILIIIMIRI